MMTDLELLKAARKLIEDAPRLLKGEYSNGFRCYCTMGACYYAELGRVAGLSYEERYAKLLGFNSGNEALWWNDKEVTKQNVLDKFDEAIKRLEASA